MKKTLLAIVAFSFAALHNFAQSTKPDSLAADSFKPGSKKFVTELNVNPFNGNISLNNSLNQIKLRYFTSPALAFRIAVTAERASISYDDRLPYGTNSYHRTEDRSSTTLGLNFGLERHFKGTRRLSPYLGADFAVGNKFSKQEIDNGTTVTTIKGAWVTGSGNSSQMTELGYTSVGLSLFSGFDIYPARHFFLGYEFNFGFNKMFWADVDYTVTGGNTSGSNSENKFSTFTFGSTLMNGIRIGYVF